MVRLIVSEDCAVEHTYQVSIPEMVRLIAISAEQLQKLQTSFNSRDGAIDSNRFYPALSVICGFNSRDGAIDSPLVEWRLQQHRSFNSRDGAIDSLIQFSFLQILYSVSIPEMVRLIVYTSPIFARFVSSFNSRDGAIDS